MHNHFSKKMIQLWLICFFLIISGCSTTHRDGPPSYNVDVSRIPDATPKVEPKSKYGNMAYYRVRGTTYHVMSSSKHYEERGIASWYGTLFHKRLTSSGEPYDMLSMTAAHKTLPLPTYVQVTNLKNGKKVIVKVNDRGPFAENRIIDLSYVAAKKLGMLGHGTAFVDIKAIDPGASNDGPVFFAENKPRHTYSSHVSSHASHTSIYLQVGAFSQKENAERLKRQLMQHITSPINITRVAHAHRPLYHVNIGPIKDLATKTKISRHVKSLGLAMKQINHRVA